MTPISWSVVRWEIAPSDIVATDYRTVLIGCCGAALAIATNDVRRTACGGGGAADCVRATDWARTRRASAAGPGGGVRTGVPRWTTDFAAGLPGRAANIVVHTDSATLAADIVAAVVQTTEGVSAWIDAALAVVADCRRLAALFAA